MRSQIALPVMILTTLVSTLLMGQGQQPANYVDDPKYLLTADNTEIWDRQGNLYHLIGVGKRIPSSLVFSSVNNIKVKFNGKKGYFVRRILDRRPDLKLLFGRDTTAGYLIKEQDILRRVRGLEALNDEQTIAKHSRDSVKTALDAGADSIPLSERLKYIDAMILRNSRLIEQITIDHITLSKVNKTIEFIAEMKKHGLKYSDRTQSWPLLRLDSICAPCVHGVSKGGGSKFQYEIKIKDPNDPKITHSERVNHGDKLNILLHGEEIKTGDLIALNPNYEFVFSGSNTTNFRSWAYKYRVTDYGLIALPVTYQFGFGGSAPNNVANLASTLSFGGYYGCRFGNVSYRYGQFSEAYHTYCVYLGGNEVTSSSLTSGANASGNSSSSSSSSNYLSYSAGVGYLVGNNVLSAGLVASIIHVLDVKSPYDYPYQNHAQLSLVIGLSLNGK